MTWAVVPAPFSAPWPVEGEKIPKETFRVHCENTFEKFKVAKTDDIVVKYFLNFDRNSLKFQNFLHPTLSLQKFRIR